MTVLHRANVTLFKCVSWPQDESIIGAKFILMVVM